MSRAPLYEEFLAALDRAGIADPFAMDKDRFEEWVARGPMKGDGKQYIRRGVWPRFRDISDQGRIVIAQHPTDFIAAITQETPPDGWYWFSVGLARWYYSSKADPDYLWAQAQFA